MKKSTTTRTQLPLKDPQNYTDQIANLEDLARMLREAQRLMPLVLANGALSTGMGDFVDVAAAWAQTFPEFEAANRAAEDADSRAKAGGRVDHQAATFSGLLVGIRAGYLLGLTVGQHVNVAAVIGDEQG